MVVITTAICVSKGIFKVGVVAIKFLVGSMFVGVMVCWLCVCDFDAMSGDFLHCHIHGKEHKGIRAMCSCTPVGCASIATLLVMLSHLVVLCNLLEPQQTFHGFGQKGAW